MTVKVSDLMAQQVVTAEPHQTVEHVKRVEAEMDGRGRVVIRYSGTESKARVMVEGEDETAVRRTAEELADTLRKALAGSA